MRTTNFLNFEPWRRFQRSLYQYFKRSVSILLLVLAHLGGLEKKLKTKTYLADFQRVNDCRLKCVEARTWREILKVYAREECIERRRHSKLGALPPSPQKILKFTGVIGNADILNTKYGILEGVRQQRMFRGWPFWQVRTRVHMGSNVVQNNCFAFL